MEAETPSVGVYALSEHVFCPRAALLTLESAADEESNEEPALGPKLDWFGDFNERLFVQALHGIWGEIRFWLTLLAPAGLILFVAWRIGSGMLGTMASFAALLLLAALGNSIAALIRLVREQAIWRAALPAELDLNSPEIREVNWWALRKAGFECRTRDEPNYDRTERLAGKPWRVLVRDRDGMCIPVVRKHRGDRSYGSQHLVRLAAHCRLLEECERAHVPFGVLLFAGSYDCVIVPNTPEAQTRLRRALADYRRFLQFIRDGGELSEPADQRCSGCHFGKPRRYVRRRSETVLRGEVLTPCLMKSSTRGGRFHCDCGDRFRWVPRHRDALALELTQE